MYLSGFFAKVSAIIATLLGGLTFLALVGGENVATGWQINVASRTRDGYWAYERIDIDRRMTYRIPLSRVIRSPPLFSPDGQLAVLDVGATHELVDLRDDTTITELSGVARTWSPDSRHLSYPDNDESSDTFPGLLLLALDENGAPSDPTSITIDGSEALEGYALWSPDNEQIAFLAYNNVSTELLLADADGSNPRRLTPTISLVLLMAWSPDGEQVAFVWLNPDDPTNIILSRVHVDGTGQEIILEGLAGQVSSLNWSPDGRYLAYIVTPAQGLFILHIESGEIIGPIDFGLAASTMQWSPDSEQIVFLSARDSDFYVVRRDGRNIRRLTNTDNLNVLMP